MRMTRKWRMLMGFMPEPWICDPLLYINIGYIWFLKNLRENKRKKKKKKRKKKWKKKVKIDKLFFICYFKIKLFILTYQYKN